MRFISTKFNNPCPICQDISGDCRTTQDNLVLCHSYIEEDSGLAGWKWRKPSENGVWGVHIFDDGKEYDRQQYQRHRELRKAQERNKKQFLTDNALDADGRERAIRKLARHLGLRDCHRQDLKTRGLSECEIEAGLFFSIDPWTSFSLNLPENLPGIHYRGGRLATKDTGYACPIFDKQGRAIGWQLRVEGVTKGNKYKWAKGTFSSHLSNSELPITIVKPQESNSKTLYLSEGILKPYIASSLHDIPVCGAAGGHFRGSPQQLAEIVSNYDELVIVPDAGDVLNSQVMQRWQRQIDELKRFNKPVKVLWWGQVSKDKHQDIDEIDALTFSNAEYLNLTKFINLAETERWKQQQWDNWNNYKKFTPQIKIEKQFIEYGLPQKNTITFIDSGLGTGKTTKLIENLSQLQEYGIIGLGYRNTLLLQFNEKAQEIGFYHLQSDKNLREFSLDDPRVKVTNCIDSLIYYVKEQFDGKIVVIDEIISVLKHLLFSGTIKQFDRVKELFTAMVNRSDRLICLDGFVADWAVKFFKELCPTKQIVTIENIYQGDKAQIYLLEGTIDINERVRTNDKTPWLKKILNSDCPAICSDSQIFCEAIENLLIEQGRVGIRVDGKTTSEPDVKEFFKNPNCWIEKNRPEYLIYSPSAESGLDIPTKNYFTEHFAFFFGQLDIDSCIQMLARIRDIDIPKYVWCKKFVLPEEIERRPSNVENIQADRARLLMAELHSTLNSIESNESKIARLQQIYQDNLDPYTTAADTIKAIRNHEFANYRECLKRQLTDNGYPVEAVTKIALDNRREIATQEQEAKTEVKQQNASDIYHASERYIGQSQVNLSFDASWETRCAVTKALLVSQLPDINRNPLWSPEFIKLVKYDKPNLIKQTELYYLLNNPDLAQQLAVEKYNRIFNRSSIAAPWKLRQDYLKVRALRDVGIYDFLDTAIANPDFTYTANSPEVTIILDKCRRRKNRDVLGMPGKDPIKFVNRLLRSVGVVTKAKKVKRKGRTIWVYLIDREHLLSEERLAILQAIELKYEQKIKANNAPLEWVADEENLSQSSSRKKLPSKTSETTITHRLDAVADSPQIYINNSTICHPQISTLSSVNSLTKVHNTNQLQNCRSHRDSIQAISLTERCIPHPMDSSESILDLAKMLSMLENAEQLAELQTVPEFTSRRLNRAASFLSVERFEQLKEWARQNQQSKMGFK